MTETWWSIYADVGLTRPHTKAPFGTALPAAPPAAPLGAVPNGRMGGALHGDELWEVELFCKVLRRSRWSHKTWLRLLQLQLRPLWKPSRTEPYFASFPTFYSSTSSHCMPGHLGSTRASCALVDYLPPNLGLEILKHSGPFLFNIKGYCTYILPPVGNKCRFRQQVCTIGATVQVFLVRVYLIV